MEGSAYGRSQCPVGRVGELRAGRVRRHGVVEHHSDAHHDLLPGWDRGETAEGEQPACVRDRERHRSAAALPGGAAIHVAERHPSRIKVVSDRDLVDFDVRPVGIDHSAGRRADQVWEGERVGKGHPDRDEVRPRRILFVDLVDRCEKVSAPQNVRAGNRAIHEPDEIPVRLVAGEVAGEIDVVEDDQPAPSGAGEADVGCQWVGRWEVPDRAISVDIDLRRGNRVDKAIYHATEIGDTTANGLRPCRDGAQQQQYEREQQDFDPPAARPRIVRVARTHLRPRPTRQSPPGLDSGGPAVVGPPRPIRPVTLRRHLSNGFAFVKIASNLTNQIRSLSKPPGFCVIPHRPPDSRRRQKVDRLHARHGRYFLRAEIDRSNPANDLRREIRRIHVSRLQHAHRHAAVRLNRQAQNHLAFQGWVIAQLPVVQPVERRLVAIEHDLYFLVGAGRTWPAACLRSIGAGNWGDRADYAACPHTTNPASSATAGASSAATYTSNPVATSASSATASYTAAQRGDVYAAARSRRITRQKRARRGLAYFIGSNVTRIGSQRRHDGVLCQARDLVLECQDAGVSHIRLCLHWWAQLRAWWEFCFASQVWTCRGVGFRFQRGCRCPWWGSGTRPSRDRTRNGDGDFRRTIEDYV